MKLSRLYSRDPYCYWCGVLTILYKRKNECPPHNAATKDHLIMKRNRWREDNNLWVLACYRCNHYRGLIQSNSLKPEDSPQRARRRTQLLNDWINGMKQ